MIKNASVALTLCAMIYCCSAAAGQFHHPVYLAAGSATSDPVFAGIMQFDARNWPPSVSTFFRPGYSAEPRMDIDNQDLVLASRRPGMAGLIPNGLFRLNRRTNAITTVFPGVGPGHNWGFESVDVDYDGNYFCLIRDLTTFDHYVVRIDQAGVASTLMSTARLGRTFAPQGVPFVDIDTGHLLVLDTNTLPFYPQWPIYSVPVRPGAHTLWTALGGFPQGVQAFGISNQNHRTGTLDGPQGGHFLRLSRGAQPITTLTTLSPSLFGMGRFDLQTAARPRIVIFSSFWTRNPAPPRFAYIDVATGAVTQTLLTTQNSLAGRIEFVEGRHTTTVLTAPRRWQLRLSAPQFPGRQYVVAAGLSGVRPAVGLADGRRINLVADALTALTLGNRLPGIWNPGPGVLDANGNAMATIDLSAIAPLGIPMWIAWAVLDPAAPLGIAYLPDTHVMRI